MQESRERSLSWTAQISPCSKHALAVVPTAGLIHADVEQNHAPNRSHIKYQPSCAQQKSVPGRADKYSNPGAACLSILNFKLPHVGSCSS